MIYEYRCEQHGTFDVDFPMGHAAERFACLVCSREVRRFYSAPMTRLAPRHLVGAIDRAEKSRDEPEVVSSLPRRHPNKRIPTAPMNPALRKLPRP